MFMGLTCEDLHGTAALKARLTPKCERRDCAGMNSNRTFAGSQPQQNARKTGSRQKKKLFCSPWDGTEERDPTKLDPIKLRYHYMSCNPPQVTEDKKLAHWPHPCIKRDGLQDLVTERACLEKDEKLYKDLHRRDEADSIRNYIENNLGVPQRCRMGVCKPPEPECSNITVNPGSIFLITNQNSDRLIPKKPMCMESNNCTVKCRELQVLNKKLKKISPEFHTGQKCSGSMTNRYPKLVCEPRDLGYSDCGCYKSGIRNEAMPYLPAMPALPAARFEPDYGMINSSPCNLGSKYTAVIMPKDCENPSSNPVTHCHKLVCYVYH